MTAQGTSVSSTEAQLCHAFEATPSVFEVLRTVRTRRIGLGYRIDCERVEAHPVTGRRLTYPAGPRPFSSEAAPVPLTDVEEALLAWAGCGPNGQPTWDRSRVAGFEEGLAAVGRTAPHAGPSPATDLLVLNDQGVFLYRPTPAQPGVVAVSEGGRYDKVLDWYHQGRIQIAEGRPDIDHALTFPDGPPLPAMGTYQHNINRPGSTWYLPVTDCGKLGSTLLTSFGTIRGYPVDEFHGGRPCGLEHLVDAGVLRYPIPISQLELGIFQIEQYPVGCIVQNIRLAAEALGLGAWCLCGFSPETLFGAFPAVTRGLGFHVEPPNPKAPLATGSLKIFGVQDVIESTYVPSPRYPSPEALVEAWWQERGEVPMESREKWVREACTRYLEYCVGTFGQWPITYNPLQAHFGVIVHHIDPEFYRAHYPEGYVTELHAQHLRSWH